MWFTTDQCHFLWKKMKGDFILRARIEFVGKGAIAHRKVGWMIRKSLDAGSPYADAAEHGNGLTALQFRRAVGEKTEQIWVSTNADVIQFERKGQSYIFSAAKYGEPFASTTLPEFNLGDDVFAGLFICSHDGDVIEKAIFRDVRIIGPPKEGYVPYHDFLGSKFLQILDVQSGKLEQIFTVPDQPGLRRLTGRGTVHCFDLQYQRTRRRLGPPMPFRPRLSHAVYSEHRARDSQQ